MPHVSETASVLVQLEHTRGSSQAQSYRRKQRTEHKGPYMTWEKVLTTNHDRPC